ncbi:hypothetical protein BJ138DRAFT_1101051 [Hygrophoropsis aurantiaca]|uniref:Uncharacterized protein n=1 Tax=Hygrophoropsis aurantiaca TaxID=72124 RepID=A0ACB8ADQ1_9AGAM|nr:hypothetical protein BJ138DRAFT_1101051 [Hygrophoropsis aurantiaca]
MKLAFLLFIVPCLAVPATLSSSGAVCNQRAPFGNSGDNWAMQIHSDSECKSAYDYFSGRLANKKEQGSHHSCNNLRHNAVNHVGSYVYNIRDGTKAIWFYHDVDCKGGKINGSEAVFANGIGGLGFYKAFPAKSFDIYMY